MNFQFFQSDNAVENSDLRQIDEIPNQKYDFLDQLENQDNRNSCFGINLVLNKTSDQTIKQEKGMGEVPKSQEQKFFNMISANGSKQNKFETDQPKDIPTANKGNGCSKNYQSKNFQEPEGLDQEKSHQFMESEKPPDPDQMVDQSEPSNSIDQFISDSLKFYIPPINSSTGQEKKKDAVNSDEKKSDSDGMIQKGTRCKKKKNVTNQPKVQADKKNAKSRIFIALKVQVKHLERTMKQSDYKKFLQSDYSKLLMSKQITVKKHYLSSTLNFLAQDSFYGKKIRQLGSQENFGTLLQNRRSTALEINKNHLRTFYPVLFNWQEMFGLYNSTCQKTNVKDSIVIIEFVIYGYQLIVKLMQRYHSRNPISAINKALQDLFEEIIDRYRFKNKQGSKITLTQFETKLKPFKSKWNVIYSHYSKQNSFELLLEDVEAFISIREKLLSYDLKGLQQNNFVNGTSKFLFQEIRQNWVIEYSKVSQEPLKNMLSVFGQIFLFGRQKNHGQVARNNDAFFGKLKTLRSKVSNNKKASDEKQDVTKKNQGDKEEAVQKNRECER